VQDPLKGILRDALAGSSLLDRDRQGGLVRPQLRSASRDALQVLG
jgi:hypothetical protein